MNFYDFIAKFKYKCQNNLQDNIKDEHEIQKAINQAKEQISILNQTQPMSPYITGSCGVASLFVSMFISVFGTNLWMIYLAIGILLSAAGYIQEKRVESHNKLKQEWYKYSQDIHQELFKNQHKKQHIEKLLKDIERCCNYYMYLVENTDKDKPITINIDEVLRSQCLLSTFLDKFYTEELEEFQQLTPTNQVLNQKTNQIDRKIYDAKREKELHIVGTEERPRHRRATRFHQPEETTEYQDTIPFYLKRKA